MRTATTRPQEECERCGHRWPKRKALSAYVPRRRCPNCFALLTPKPVKEKRA